MKTVHKYVLNDVENGVSTFERVKFLHVDNQREQICLWAEVNTLERECVRTVYVVGTGNEVPSGTTYLGSAVMAGGDFVFHVYTTTDPRATARETTEPEEGGK